LPCRHFTRILRCPFRRSSMDASINFSQFERVFVRIQCIPRRDAP
jgi:hypothetical protein